MKLQTYNQTAVRGANTQSVSLRSPENMNLAPIKSPKETEEDLWQEISEELANGFPPAWMMWR